MRLRGKRNLPTKHEQEFWDRFPELLSDDPEDTYNELISELRIVAQEWFASLHNPEEGEDYEPSH